MLRHTATKRALWGIRTALSLGLALTLMVADVAVPSATPRADDVRGLWVLRSTLASPKSVQQMVTTAQQSGFNTIIVQVRGRGDAYYNSRIEPRAAELEDQPLSFDPLAMTIELAHAAGLKVHAWFNVDLVSSATLLPRARTHVVALHPEWVMVPKSLAQSMRNAPTDTPAYLGQIARTVRAQSDQVEGLYLSPVLQASRDYTTSVVSDLVSRYSIDGLHLDYLRYPNEAFDYSPASLAAFRAAALPTVTAEMRARLDALLSATATAWTDALPRAWSDFRRQRLTQLATSIRTAAVTARPGLMITAAVAPSADEARDGRLQDWRLWAQSGIIDALCPMIYTTDPAEFADAVARVKSDAGVAAVWAGIGAYKLTPARTIENLRTVRKAGVAGVLLYSYDSLTSGDAVPNYFSLIRSTLVEQIQSPNGR